MPLTSNCKKEVSMLCGILWTHETHSASQAEIDEDDNADHIFQGISGGDLEGLGRVLRPFLSGLGVVDGGLSKPNMSKGRAHVQAEERLMLEVSKGTPIRMLLMVRCLVQGQAIYTHCLKG